MTRVGRIAAAAAGAISAEWTGGRNAAAIESGR
jgi:hypothetical protein